MQLLPLPPLPLSLPANNDISLSGGFGWEKCRDPVKAQIYRGYALLQELIAQKDGDDVGMQRGAEELLASIGRLPKVYQEVLYLYHIEGRKQHEIAQRLQRPLGTVKAQISRGLKLLNKQTAKSQEQAAELSLENV
jgi:DNA-directed RNA polymerase specialized sigma24 family protein